LNGKAATPEFAAESGQLRFPPIIGVADIDCIGVQFGQVFDPVPEDAVPKE
jgi:hypothetical protein